jgi:hypothetical protein
MKLLDWFRLPFTLKSTDNRDLDLLRIIDDANFGEIRLTLT